MSVKEIQIFVALGVAAGLRSPAYSGAGLVRLLLSLLVVFGKLGYARKLNQ